MTEPKGPREAWLRAHRDRLFFDPDGPGEHLSDEHLDEVLRGRARLSRTERRHLAACSECRDVAAALGDGAPTTTPGWLGGLQGWLRPSMAIPAAAAVAAAVWVVAGPFGGDDGGAYRSRGGEETRTDVSSVTLMATDAAGGRRDIRDGDVLQRSDRLGFRYGNPRGDHERLVILGWDQHTLHWYYPEAPHRLAFKVQSGPRALSLRLPFDIRLAETHRPGPLVIAAAFDTSPVVLAAELKAGRVRTSTRGWTVFRVTIEE